MNYSEDEVNRLTVFGLLVPKFRKLPSPYAKNLISKMREVLSMVGDDNDGKQLQELIEQLKWVDSVECEPADEVKFRLYVFRQVKFYLMKKNDTTMAHNLLSEMVGFAKSKFMDNATDEQKEGLRLIGCGLASRVYTLETQALTSVVDAKKLLNHVLEFYSTMKESDDRILDILDGIYEKYPQVVEELWGELSAKDEDPASEVKEVLLMVFLYLRHEDALSSDEQSRVEEMLGGWTDPFFCSQEPMI